MIEDSRRSRVITGIRAMSTVTHTGGIDLWLVDRIGSRLRRSAADSVDRTDGNGRRVRRYGRKYDDEPGRADGATVVLEFDPAPEADRPSDADVDEG